MIDPVDEAFRQWQRIVREADECLKLSHLTFDSKGLELKLAAPPEVLSCAGDRLNAVFRTAKLPYEVISTEGENVKIRVLPSLA